ncbi:glycosyltransferase [Eggerthella timonensis]|uniref:glycosyltransferase n=1 Tax=Eggerthella timonensis TaxID=1871008 RepID=UPI0015E10ADB|nr:glycosyltransferase [Eggerthella timonensis]
MRLLHVGLSSHFTDGMTYQDNMLVEQNVRDGHTVMYVSDCQSYSNGRLVRVAPGIQILSCGATLIRLRFAGWPAFLAEKIQLALGLKNILDTFSPNVILYHSLAGVELLAVSEYVGSHPDIRLFVDTHADFNNSGRGPVSKRVLHAFLYKKIVQRSLPNITKVLPIACSCLDFASKIYGVPSDKMELFPLGGRLIPDNEYLPIRERLRKNWRVKSSDIIFFHSGKLDSLKKTQDVLIAFSQVKASNFRLYLAGSADEQIKTAIVEAVKRDNRIVYLGWVEGSALLECLCACDVYVQPGSVSVSAQSATCCRCALILFPHPDYQAIYEDSCLYASNKGQIIDILCEIAQGNVDIELLSRRSYNVAIEKLDYEKLAARLYE